MEEWRKVKGTNGMIEVSNEGRVRSLLRGTPYVLKTQSDSKGYQRVNITICRISKTYKLHRIVAEAFIPNPDNKPQVNHIDGNKMNNAVSNLEWVTNDENRIHAIEKGLWNNCFEASKKTNNSRKKKIVASKDDIVLNFDSISEAERYFDSRHICDVLKGKRQHVKGWSFAYKGGDDLCLTM